MRGSVGGQRPPDRRSNLRFECRKPVHTGLRHFSIRATSRATCNALLFCAATPLWEGCAMMNVKFPRRRFLHLAAGAAALPALPHIARAQAYPTWPVKTVQEFIEYAKANPGQLSMASSGVGASPHLSGELFKFMTKIDMVHVPYRGSAAAYPDLVSGKVHMLFDNLGGPVLELARSGKLRLLGVTTADRWEALPDIPAVAETVPGYEVVIWD